MSRSSVDAPEEEGNAPPRRRGKMERHGIIGTSSSSSIEEEQRHNQLQLQQQRLFNPDDYIIHGIDDEATHLQQGLIQQQQQQQQQQEQQHQEHRNLLQRPMQEQWHHGRVVSHHTPSSSSVSSSSSSANSGGSKSNAADITTTMTPTPGDEPHPHYSPKNSILEVDESNQHNASSSSYIASYRAGLEEANLLSRAMERRALLQDRIIAMEKARAKLGSGGGGSEVDTPSYNPINNNNNNNILHHEGSEEDDVVKQWQRRERRRRRNHRLEGIEGCGRHLPLHSPERTFDEPFFTTFDDTDTATATTTTTTSGNNNNNVNNSNNDYSNANLPTGANHQRMNELSEQIKREAIDFMNHDAAAAAAASSSSSSSSSSRMKIEQTTGEKEIINNNSEECGSAMNDDGSSIILTPWTMNGLLNGSLLDHTIDDELNCIEEEEVGDDDYDDDDYYSDAVQQLQQQHSDSSPRRLDCAASIDTSAWDDEGIPTPQQLAQYTNMVRVGIPDVAVLRAMERDGIVDMERILLSLKRGQQQQQQQQQTVLSTTKIETENQVPQVEHQISYSSSSISSSSNKSAPSYDEGQSLDKKEGRRMTLGDDPNYSKYFKMVKAKVPQSWVKRVLEVDGKDARVLDLDPDRTLMDQLPEGAVDEFGIVNWDKVERVATPTSQSNAILSSTANDSNNNNIPADTFASVKAELAMMRAKAGEMTSGLKKVDNSASTKSNSPVDISSEALAASNARIDRSKAAASSMEESKSGLTDIGRRRQSVDEIRRRVPQPPPPSLSSSSMVRSTYPSAMPPATTVNVNAKQTNNDLPLKDDPRYSKYFQMIRSRVPRSWVERVIEVDDRDPAILDLDPNRSYSSQMGSVKNENNIIDDSATTHASIVSETPTSAGVDKIEQQQSEVADNSQSMPIIQINDNKNDDDRSDTSSITFRDNQDDKSIELSRISLSLQRLDGLLNEQASKDGADADVMASRLSRFTSAEEVEKKLNELIDRFDAKKANDESNNTMSDTQKEMLEKSQADITKLSALLNKEIAGADTEQPIQSSLDILPSLLSQVIRKLEQPIMEESEEVENDSTKSDSPNKALESLFAKRIALAEEVNSQPKQLCDDPEYSKYFKMLKMGLPRESVRHALERDGKDVKILDLDPNCPLSDQKEDVDENVIPDKNAALKALFSKRAAALDNKDGKVAATSALEALFAKRAATPLKQEGSAPALRVDPEFEKYMKMLKVGMPKENVRKALERDGKDGRVADMDPEKSYASQVKVDVVKIDVDLPLKDDPEYSKYFRMIKMGLPVGAVMNSMQKDGKDPNIINFNPEKSLSEQQKLKEKANTGPPLKDDPEYSKYFKMLKMGLPMGAVMNSMQKDGKDSSIINLNPEKSLSEQQQAKTKETPTTPKKIKGSTIVRKRLHWNKIDESKLSENSFWNQAKDQASIQLAGLDIDNEEFASLFTSSPNKKALVTTNAAPDAKKPKSNQKVQLIDGRRRMNGSILLKKFKVNYLELARQVDQMEVTAAEGNELRGMMQLLPTKDESLALRSYLPPVDAPQSEIDESIAKLGECEQYMAVMLDIEDVQNKFQAMVFRAEFDSIAESIRHGTNVFMKACESVKNSERFRKLLLYALKLGNALNTDGSTQEVTAITLDSLLKLAEAKAFDRQTSVLHYLVSILQKNDEDVLRLAEDFVPVKAAERVSMDMIAQQLREMETGVGLVTDVAKRHLIETPVDSTTPVDDLVRLTAMGQFSFNAESTIQTLIIEFADVKNQFVELLQFFGEDSAVTPEQFFCTINSIVSVFDHTHKELKRKEEAKVSRSFVCVCVCLNSIIYNLTVVVLHSPRSGRKG